VLAIRAQTTSNAIDVFFMTQPPGNLGSS